MVGARIIGLLGGSFNPAHEGHVHISLEMLKRLKLDEIWWLVSPQNPLKPKKGMADFATRFASAKAQSRRFPKIQVSDFEQRHRTSYTADTLALLARLYPQARFVWIMGADNLAQIHRWQNWKRIFACAAIAVFDRSPYTYKALKSHAAIYFFHARTSPRALSAKPLPAWTFVHGKRHPLSATFLRNSLGIHAYIRHNENAVNAKRR